MIFEYKSLLGLAPNSALELLELSSTMNWMISLGTILMMVFHGQKQTPLGRENDPFHPPARR